MPANDKKLAQLNEWQLAVRPVVVDEKKSPAKRSGKLKERAAGQTQSRPAVVSIFTSIFLVICLLILATAIAVAVVAKKTDQGIVIAGYQSFLIATGSMEPTLKINSLAVIRHGNFDAVQIGDVVAFNSSGLNHRTALHRVIEIRGTGDNQEFITQGDNNTRPDGAPVTRSNYLGRVAWQTNLTASFLSTLKQPGGWWRATLLPIILLVLLSFATRWLLSLSHSRLGKILILAVIVLFVSGVILIAYLIFTTRKVNFTNTALAAIAADFAQCNPGQNRTLSGQEILGRIEIPKLNLDYPIIDYVSATSLDVAITHFSGAPINEPGNNVLAGHRVFGQNSPFEIFFTQLDQLQAGDEIYLTDVNCQRIKYVVQDFKMVTPDDISVLAPPALPAARLLTLISCSYDLQNRYIVRALAE